MGGDMNFYNNARAKQVILFLALTVCYLYLAVQKLERVMDQSSYRELQGNVTIIIDQPVFYKKIYGESSVIQDICERWGYTIRMIMYGRAAANMDDMAKHRDVYAQRYCDVMRYRLFQNQTSDMILDYLPAINEFVTFKARLVSNGGKYIPKGFVIGSKHPFVIPDQLQEFIRYFHSPKNKDKRWIQKNFEHRGVVVRTTAEINTELDLQSASLLQEYIGNPLLLDGRKFTLGIYVAFSSGNPMKAYILESSVLFRACEKEYYPEDLGNEATYSCDSDELYDIKFVLQIEPLKTYRMKYKYTSRKALDAFLSSKGKDPVDIFAQIYDAIHDVLSQSVKRVEQGSDVKIKYTELTRWDFLIDANMQIYLMEANYSPGLGCKKLPLLGDCCHHVMYNVLRVMGYERPLQWNTNSAFHVRDADVNILDRKCFSTTCSSCTLMECRLCSHCLTERQVSVFKEVLREHFHRGTTGLVYPYVKRDIGQKHVVDSDEQINDNRNITLLTHWLEAKCKRDQNWCSRY